jgi:hypothetical protein
MGDTHVAHNDIIRCGGISSSMCTVLGKADSLPLKTGNERAENEELSRRKPGTEPIGDRDDFPP